MKQMNQIILEGFIAEKEEQRQFYDKKCLMFTLGYIKEYKGADGEKHESVYEFKVLVAGKMAEIILKKRLGTKLRLVGSLEELPDGQLAISAEHIEFKPDLTQNNLE